MSGLRAVPPGIVLLLLALSPRPVPGQTALVICDSSLDRVVRLEDRDGSGRVELEQPGEVLVVYDDSSPGPDLSTPSGLALGPRDELYLLDGGTLDAILVLADRNGDGDANDDGEFRVFYDGSSRGPDPATPNALAFSPGGDLYVVDDGRRRGRILRLTDLDGNGDALADDEWFLFYDSVTVEAESPGVPVLPDPEALAIDGEGRLFVSDAAAQAIFLLEDANGDGDAMDTGEVREFYSPAGQHPFVDPEALSFGPGGQLYATDEDTGLIIWLLDADGDGQALGSSEARVFVDDGAVLAPRDTNDLVVGSDGAVWVLDGSRDQVFRLIDGDGDGTALSAGEVAPLLIRSDRVLGTPSGVVLLEGDEGLFVSSVDPGEGPLAGGNRVQLTGRFPAHREARVVFGAVEAEIVLTSPGLIECVAPEATVAVAVAIRVTTPGREVTLPGAYRYLAGGAFTRGDTNQDVAIDLTDAVVILRYLFLGGDPLGCIDSGDVDDDGSIAISDPIYLLSYLFLAGPLPPPPFPDRGIDPTPDGLGECQ